MFRILSLLDDGPGIDVIAICLTILATLLTIYETIMRIKADREARNDAPPDPLDEKVDKLVEAVTGLTETVQHLTSEITLLKDKKCQTKRPSKSS